MMKKSHEIYSFILQISIRKVVVVLLSITALQIVFSLDFWINLLRAAKSLPNGYHITFLVQNFRSQAINSFIPILAAVLTAGNYIEILKNKVAIYCLIRSSYCSTLFCISLVCFLFGGGVILAGAIVSYGVITALLSPVEVYSKVNTVSYTCLYQTFGLLFLNGGFWAIMGMTISTVMESKYIAYASPFVIYYLLVILCERYLPNAFLLYPPNWTNPDVWPFGVWGASVFLLELTALCGIVFTIRAGRRLREL